MPYCRSSPRASSGCTRAQYARGVVDNTRNQCPQSTHRSPMMITQVILLANLVGQNARDGGV